LTWEQFCRQHAGIHRSYADQIIRNLDEFGTDRLIRGSVQNHRLIHGEEEIPLQVEQTERLLAAADALRREAAVQQPPSADAGGETERQLVKAAPSGMR